MPLPVLTKQQQVVATNKILVGAQQTAAARMAKEMAEMRSQATAAVGVKSPMPGGARLAGQAALPGSSSKKGKPAAAKTTKATTK